MSETDIQRSILAALNKLGPWCFAMRNSVVQRGAYQGGLGRGSADIIACVCGQFVALEVKTSKGVAAEHQLEWGNRLDTAGGVYAIVRSVQDAAEIVLSVREREGRRGNG